MDYFSNILKGFIFSSFHIFIFNAHSQEIPTSKTIGKEVGDIVYDPKVDKRGVICNPKYIVQYYQVNTRYVGGSKAIEEFFRKRMKYKKWPTNSNGIITFRFVVSCNGQTDRFRVYQLDSNYKQTKFNPIYVNDLLSTCKLLKNWIPGKIHSGDKVDSYYNITFNIKNGALVIL